MAERAIHDDVLDVLRESQRLGFLGDRPVGDAATHSRSFVTALEPVRGRVVDIGAGGGLPGLVVAHDRPDLELLLVDRRGKRVDFLRRVVRRLGWTDRVSVRDADVREVIRQEGAVFDAVIARGFGPPADTIGFAAGLVVRGGRIVISEPPTGERWGNDDVVPDDLSVVPHVDRRVSVFQRAHSDVSRETS